MIINVDKIKLCKCFFNESVFELNFVKFWQIKALWSQRIYRLTFFAFEFS